MTIQITIDNPGVGEFTYQGINDGSTTDPGLGAWKTNTAGTRLEISETALNGFAVAGFMNAMDSGVRIQIRANGEDRAYVVQSVIARATYSDISCTLESESPGWSAAVGARCSIGPKGSGTSAATEGTDIKSTGEASARVLTTDGADGATWEPQGSPGAHALGGSSHTADTLANLNLKINDATLDDSSAARPPTTQGEIDANTSHSTGSGSDHADVATNSAHSALTTGNPHQVEGDEILSTGEADSLVLTSDGANGATWSVPPGGSLNFEDEGSPVAGGPHDTVNFLGGGILAENAGGGQVNVTVAPGSAPLDSWGPVGAPRTGIVNPIASDYDASQIDNDSNVTGDFVDDALNTLDTAVGLNTTHATSDGSSHSDVVANTAKVSYTDAAVVAGLAAVIPNDTSVVLSDTAQSTIAPEDNVAGNGADLKIHAGDSPSNDGGDLWLDPGLNGSGGTDGEVKIGTTGGSVQIGSSGVGADDTVLASDVVTVSSGDLKVGDGIATASIAPRTRNPGTDLTVSGGPASGANPAGDLNLDGGNSDSGTDGGVNIGLANTTAVNIGVDVDVTGNITVSGTVDGIDVATDVGANTTHAGLTSGNPHEVEGTEVKSTAAGGGLVLTSSAGGLATWETAGAPGAHNLGGASHTSGAEASGRIVESDGAGGVLWADPPPDGNVVAPTGSVVDEDIAVFDGTDGELLKKLSGVTSAALIANTAHLTDAANPHSTSLDNLVPGTHAQLENAVPDAGSILASLQTGQVQALTEKGTPVGADVVLIEDSAAAGAKKKVQLTNLLDSSTDVTLAGTPDYITIDGNQVITREKLDVADDVNAWTHAQLENQTPDAGAIFASLQSGQVATLTTKASPTASDWVPIGDTAASGGWKKAAWPSAASEVNDLTASVTWANIPDANVPESAVTQHEAALSVTESQISGSITASDLGTTGASVNIDAAAPPTVGQILKATSATVATWQNETGGAGILTGAVDPTTEGSTGDFYYNTDKRGFWYKDVGGWEEVGVVADDATIEIDATNGLQLIGFPAASTNESPRKTAGGSIEWIAINGTVDTTGSPVATNYARFTDGDTIQGRTPAEVIGDLGIDDDITTLTIGASATVSGSNTGDEVAATTTTAGIVELATDGESAANVVVQGDDARLSDARTPTTHAYSSHSGTVPSDDFADNTIAPARLATQADSGALIFNATGVPAYLGPGNSGDVLTSGGTGVIPSWSSGAETNDLATDGISGIADDQLAVGTGAGTAAYQTLANGAVSYNTTTGAFSQAALADLSDGGSALTSESNNLETTCTGIAANEIVFGAGADTASYSTIDTLTDEPSPTTGDVVLIQTTEGLRKLDVSNFPVGSETNNLATDGIAGIADNQLAVGTGAGTAAYGTINTDSITDDAVTYVKMQNVASDNVFLGNNSGAGGAVDELTGTEATALLDTFATDATTQGLVPGSNSLGATYYLDGNGSWSVPAGGGGEDNNLETVCTDIAANELPVGTGTDTVTYTSVGTNTVVGRVAGNVVAAQLVDGQIADDTISNGKLANMAANTVKANATAGSANPADLSVGTNTVVGRVAGNIVAAQIVEGQVADNAITLAKMAGGTDGNLITYDASGDPAYVSTGDSGEVLTSNGAGAAPTFQTAPAGTPASTVATSDASAGVVGTDTEYARQDHEHQIVTTGTPGDATPGDSASAGSSDSLARVDHQHGLPSFGTGATDFCVGNDSRLSDARTPTSHAYDSHTGTVPIADIAGTPTGTGDIVLESSPTIVTPTIASFTDATHDHEDAAGGGQLGTNALADNAVTLAKMAGGTDGNLITYDTNGDPAYVATGTANQVLTSNGAGAAPTFEDATAGSEVNDLATDGVTGIADNQLAVGTGAGTAGYATLPTTGAVAFNGTAFAQAALADLSDVTTPTGTGEPVLASSPTITTPTIASFTNATHDHADAAGGGTIAFSALTGTLASDDFADNTIAVGRLVNGTDGELITWSAAGVATTVAVGTSGHVLTSGGTGVAPTFQALPSAPTLSKSLTIEDPTASENKALFYTNVAITVTQITAVIVGSTSVDFNISHGTSRAAVTNDVMSADDTADSTTTGNITTSFGGGDPTIPADSFVALTTSALSGTPTEFHVTVEYTEDG